MNTQRVNKQKKSLNQLKRKISYSPHNTTSFIINDRSEYASICHENFEDIQIDVGGSMVDIMEDKLFLESCIQNMVNYSGIPSSESIYFRIQIPSTALE